ncbi:MAG: acylphosphatase [Xanthomonadales bacterium]|nr:acylphosphatase [Xanthomonadales bacterium]NIN59290.1 acylphosphatase [Xanthomonadales bacterium]NIN74652.1 acylphosphatase [Xanthomonadales bacterium]NIO13318.1 acylphosphatase [Xanthomonadales bacterium]NIP11683.1 acylphosphatase [Xanthomonadales bacterium]
MTRCRKFRIEGRVQGVWFRESTRREALALGISGHALNCPDGSVEVVACGAPAALERLHEWLHKGPPLAEVRRVEELEAPPACGEGFTTG